MKIGYLIKFNMNILMYNCICLLEFTEHPSFSWLIQAILTRYNGTHRKIFTTYQEKPFASTEKYFDFLTRKINMVKNT